MNFFWHQKQPIQVARHNREHLPAPSKDTPKTSAWVIEKVGKPYPLGLANSVCICGHSPTTNQPGGGSAVMSRTSSLNELLDPKEEQEVGEYLNVFNGGDLEIIAMVQAKGDDIEEIDSDSDDDQPEAVPPSLKEMIDACRVLEEGSLLVCTDALDFVEAARRFRGRLQKMSHKGTKQTTIDMFFNTK